MSNILITGATGYLGSEVLAKLTDLKVANIYFTYRDGNKLANASGSAHGLKLDLLQPAQYIKFRKQLNSVECLVHIASYVPGKTALPLLEDMEVNILSNHQMLINLLRNLPNIKKAVLISSCSADLFLPQIGFYGVGKRALEDAIHQYARIKNISSIAVRLPQIFGPNEPHDMYVTKFIRSAITRQRITLASSARDRRDLIYVETAADAITQALSLEGALTITVSSDRPHSIEEICKKICSITGQKLENVILPPSFDKPKTLHSISNYKQYGIKLKYSIDFGLEKTINVTKDSFNV